LRHPLPETDDFGGHAGAIASGQQQPIAYGDMPRQPIDVDNEAGQATHAPFNLEGGDVTQAGTATSRSLSQASQTSHCTRPDSYIGTDCKKATSDSPFIPGSLETYSQMVKIL
jgi:hypothetical protein